MRGGFIVVYLGVGALALPVPTVLLSHTVSAVHMPVVMLGTGGGGGGFDADAWLSVGGNAFDIAAVYCYPQFRPFCSQAAVANAVTRAGLNSSSVFLLSKMEPEDMGPESALVGEGRALTHGVLEDTSITSIGAALWHQAGRHAADTNIRPVCYNASAAGPVGPGAYAACRAQGWASLLAASTAGLVAAPGVSNFQVRELQQLFDATGTWPSLNEIEVHPYWHEDDIIDFCIAHNITVVNYAPLAKATALGDPAVLAVAAAHGVLPAQAVLRWGLQRTQGVVIPRSVNATHMTENLDIFDFVLSATEMAALSALPQKKIYNTYCQPWC